MTTNSFLWQESLCFFSFSSDDPDPFVRQDFSHFTVTSTNTLADDSLSPGNYSYTETLLDRRRFKVTQNGVTTQRIFTISTMITTALDTHFVLQ